MLSLPATVVTPRISSSGEPRARMRARPSSAGGMTKSVSKMTLCGAGAAATPAGAPNDSVVSTASGSLMPDTIGAPSGAGQPEWRMGPRAAPETWSQVTGTPPSPEGAEEQVLPASHVDRPAYNHPRPLRRPALGAARAPGDHVELVHHRHAAGQRALALHVDAMAAPSGADRRVEGDRHGHGVGQRDPGIAEHLPVRPEGQGVAVDREAGERSVHPAAERDVLLVQVGGAPAELPPHHLDGEAGPEADAGRLRVAPDVVLGGRGHVPHRAGRAPDHDEIGRA